MKYRHALPIGLLIILSVWNLNAQQWIDSREREIVIRSVNVIPMDAELVIPNQTVVISKGKITAIDAKPKYSKNALVIDGKGKYLMPGLAEMHAHVPPIDDLEPMKEVLFLFAANGITTIRGMLGHPKHLELRSMIQQGTVNGPHFYTTGPSFNGISVRTAEAGAEMVRRQKEMGYDFLKLHPGLNLETFPAIASTAHEVGIPFAGHVSYAVGVWRAIDAGYSSIDHLDGFVEALVPGIDNVTEQEAGLFGMFVGHRADVSRIPSLMKALKEKNIWVVPTQSLAEKWFSPTYNAESFRNDPNSKYMAPQTVEQWITTKKNLLANPLYNSANIESLIRLRRQLILECQKNGVGLLLGCDAPQVFNVPGFSTHQELVYLVESGLTPYQALRTGTVNVARYLKLDDSGVIRTGAVADLVLVNGNPLTDITQTQNISGVMLNGKWLSKAEIDSGLRKLEKQ
ncbi:MAG: amidohydrolase family protein [Cyclobacteriaceae bacterium]|jgi:imidazolonepropionase-like amidohydrolase|nr:amidohydrolase family protein [Cyclobacteriaceae bacterium]